MSKLLVALIAASFATVAGAQAGATKQEKQPSRSPRRPPSTSARRRRRRREGHRQKTDPKALPDKGSKQAATATTTKAQTEGRRDRAVAAAEVAKAKSEKGTKAAKPDLKDPAVQKAMQKASTQ